MAVKVGDKAPEFTLHATDKSEVSLNDYRGQNVVILFFPLAFTGTCTKELCTIRDELSLYEGLNAQILAISVDTVPTLKKYKEENEYQFPLLSDFNKNVSRSYGAFYEEFILGMIGVSKRAAFIINSKGTIRYAEILENAGDLPNFAAMKRKLSQLNS